MVGVYQMTLLYLIFLFFTHSLCSTFLKSEISESLTKNLCGPVKGEGRAMIVNTEETDHRVDINQLIIKVYDIFKSTNLKLDFELKETQVIGISSEIKDIPISLLVSEDCCSESIQIGEILYFYSTCWRENVTYSYLKVRFNSIHTASCNECKEEFCGNDTCGENCDEYPCLECEIECGNTRVSTTGEVYVFQPDEDEINKRSSSSTTFSQKLSTFISHHKMGQFTSTNDIEEDIIRKRQDEIDLEIPEDLLEYLVDQKIIPFQIHKECNLLGQDSRQISITPGNENLLSDILQLTPSDSILSNPPLGDLTSLCLINVIPGINITTNVHTEDSVKITDDIRVVSLPYIGYHPQTELLVRIECRYHFDPSKDNNLEWTTYVQVTRKGVTFRVRLKTKECPNTAHSSSRVLDENLWEITVLGGYPGQELLKTYNVIFECQNDTKCELQHLNVYQDTPFNGESILLDDYGTFDHKFGSDITIGYTEDGYLLVSSAFLISETTQYVLMYKTEDWLQSYSIEELSNFTSETLLPYSVVTVFPNQNIQFGSEPIRSLQTLPFYEDLFLSYDYGGNASFTVIRSCKKGSQFILYENETRVCSECPPGQFKDNRLIGQNCELCPEGTYANASGTVDSAKCLECMEGECPSGAYSPILDPLLDYSCTNPWFVSSGDVDLEGSFYINQRNDVLLMFIFAAIIVLTIVVLVPPSIGFFRWFGMWFWRLDEDAPNLKKFLWSLAGFGIYAGLILLFSFTIHVYLNENILVTSELEVGNAVATSYPDLFKHLSESPLWLELTLKGRISQCDKSVISVTTKGFFDTRGFPVQPVVEVTDLGDYCSTLIYIPSSTNSEEPQIYFQFHPHVQDQYIYELQVEMSTKYDNQTKSLSKCVGDVLVTNNKEFDEKCNSEGYSYLTSSLRSAPGRTLRGSSSLTVSKTPIVVQKCEYIYFDKPFNMELTKSSCNYCESSTVMLFAYAIESVQQDSEYYYLGSTSLSMTITLQTDTYSRISSILPLLSDGGLFLNLLITGVGFFGIVEAILVIAGIAFEIDKYRKK